VTIAPTVGDLQQRVQRRVGGWYERVNARWCYLFLLPALILTAMFTFYPMIMSWVFSTMRWSGFNHQMTIVGLDNYAELVQDPMFWSAFGRSAIFMLVGTPIRVVLALLVAIVLNQKVMRLSPVFRTMFFLPVTAAAAVIGVVMTFVLSPNNGPLNTVLVGSGLVQQPVEFLSDPGMSLWTVLLVHVWKNFGITMIYWLAALQTIPQDYIEAARIDGAGMWGILRHIRLPILLPFAVIIIILTAKDNLHAFGIVWTMTGGGPYFSTQLIEIYIYQTAFQPEMGSVPRLGYASAAGCFFGVATLIFTVVQLWAARKVAEARASFGTDGRDRS
jgi:multiple sugar transport system permease protein